MINLIKWFKFCRKVGQHHWQWAGDTIGGVWIKCCRCGQLDEYLPGTHEPKGYTEEMYMNDAVYSKENRKQALNKLRKGDAE